MKLLSRICTAVFSSTFYRGSRQLFTVHVQKSADPSPKPEGEAPIPFNAFSLSSALRMLVCMMTFPWVFLQCSGHFRHLCGRRPAGCCVHAFLYGFRRWLFDIASTLQSGVALPDSPPQNESQKSENPHPYTVLQVRTLIAKAIWGKKT